MTDKKIPVCYLLIALIISSLPYATNGYPLGDDSIGGLIRVKEFQLALSHRQWPPYWAENLYGGYGSPIFLFYAPLYMTTATVFYCLTGSLIGGSMMATVFFTIVAVIGIYLLVLLILEENSPINRSGARIAAYAFVLNPYLIGDKFIRIANSEYTALCLAPIALIGLIKIKQHPYSGSMILSAGFAATILAHNLTALTVASMLLLLSPLIHYQRRPQPSLHAIILGMILGLLLSLFFWLPALSYKSLTHTEQLIQGKVDFRNQFAPWLQLFNHSQFFSMGLFNLWLLVESALILRTEARRKIGSGAVATATVFFLIGIGLIFLQTRLSLWLWENLPFLALFQFPWRMMGPLALSMAVTAGVLFPIYFRKKNYGSHLKLECAILCLCVINILPLLTAKLQTSPALLAKLTTLLESNAHSGWVFSSTEVDEYLPKSAKIRLQHFAKESSPLILDALSAKNIEIVKATGTEIQFTTDSSESLSIELKRWFFPGWHARINNRELPVEMSARGLLSIRIPSGHNSVRLKLQPPRLRQVSVGISWAALLAWLILAIGPTSRKTIFPQ